jgi:uncharacterized protein YecE (DUF72 family)
MKVKVGCCGWGYLKVKDYYGEKWKERFTSILSAYSSLFSVVEVNSTFYRIPKDATLLKWYNEAKEQRKDFEFTVKANQIITHKAKFEEGAFLAFEKMISVCKKLDARILLFQTPAGFGPTEENIRKMDNFFKKVAKRGILFAWEPRGKWKKEKKKIREICEKFDIIHCVDPFRETPLYCSKNIAYFRIHGLGKNSIYDYKFSLEELTKLKEKINALKCKEVYVFFNNIYMYTDALSFK